MVAIGSPFVRQPDWIVPFLGRHQTWEASDEGFHLFVSCCAFLSYFQLRKQLVVLNYLLPFRKPDKMVIHAIEQTARHAYRCLVRNSGHVILTAKDLIKKHTHAVDILVADLHENARTVSQ